LFATNERVTSLLETAGGRVAVVKVGATNVGSISVSYDSFLANQNPSLNKERNSVSHRSYCPSIPFDAGDEIGVFNLGSTVILLFEKGSFVPNSKCKCGSALKMGESIGSYS